MEIYQATIEDLEGVSGARMDDRNKRGHGTNGKD